MPYCTLQNMIDRFGDEELIQLTDRDGAGAVDETVLDQAIADAGAEIDGWLAGRYPLPLAEVPPSLTLRACDMARYFLYAAAPTELVQARYDAAVTWLKAVARGDVALVLTTGATAETAGMAEFEDGRTVFNNGGGF